jgi:hypothetical protein
VSQGAERPIGPGGARLDELISELEAAAARLRTGQLGGDEAAELVEQCAELATRVGAELDAEARSASEAPGGPADAGQEQLL